MSEIRCMWMRGGTSKGGYFLADDLPVDSAARDALLLEVMGSPDARQIDGLGGGDPLTSKVAVVRRSERPGCDVDYLFLQVFVDQPIVSDAQNCGNILAGVGPFAIERGLVAATHPETVVRIHMENTGQVAVVRVATPNGRVAYTGETRLDGVPFPGSPLPIVFTDTAGSSCGALLPTGNVMDDIAGYRVTCIDNGMPVVVVRAEDVGVRGDESRAELDADVELKAKLEAIRLAAGPLMKLGNVAEQSVPKMTLVSAPRQGGVISTRSFIPHRCHASIGVFGAVSVATAAAMPGSVACDLAQVPAGRQKEMLVEHPSGATRVLVETGEGSEFVSAGLVLTARKLFDGVVFAHRQSANGQASPTLSI
ncbi:MAG: 4-oxalomesaconate tautomerase [Dechloromonas agitata]|uniref:4-oxalomesaconate tautomerase n=1 Tax=Dechloromonas agitata TaxID=73030 RepID=A0A930FYL8_9RHOO|nr:4-oxalomesaconate tautomerase [Dechloromonas agitata]